MNNFIWGLSVGSLAGGAVIWVIKEWLVKVIVGAEGLRTRLQASLDALKK